MSEPKKRSLRHLDVSTLSDTMKRLNPQLFQNETDPLPKVQGPKPQRHKAAALGATGEGKEESLRRTRVRFIGYRVRPLDPDNFAGGCKDALDGLRHAGLISGDEPWRIIFETGQVKVAHFTEEKTVIEIES